jgi:N-formylglutamate amidohydrolase
VPEKGDDILRNGSSYMDSGTDFPAGQAFAIHEPVEQRVPFIFNSPHSGNVYTERFLAMSRLDARQIRRSEDCFVDEIFAGAVALGAPMLAARFPRAWLDVNREPFELDPRMFREPLPAHVNARSARVAGGLGTVPRLVGEGQEIYAAKLPVSEALDRIRRVYVPYHEALKGLLRRTMRTFGHAILIDCHSMPASVRVGETGLRPDFIVGDRFGLSCGPGLSESAIDLLSAMGYIVAHNKPYAGGFITEHYGRPAEGVQALQIELSRGIYLDETTLERTPGFTRLAADMTRFCGALMGADDLHLDNLPLAAE